MINLKLIAQRIASNRSSNSNVQPEIHDNGDKFWYVNNKLHREDGPAIEKSNGTKEWYINGKCHREDGPAIEDAEGGKSWYLNGNLHREDGPAIEYANGDKEWYLDGNEIEYDPKTWDQLVNESRIKNIMNN